jgi:putative inorganic carbon (HCO3(-)) transporter
VVATVGVGSVALGGALALVGLRAGVVPMLAIPAAVGLAALALTSRAAVVAVLCLSFPVGLVTLVEAPVRVQAIDVAAFATVAAVVGSRLITGSTPIEWSSTMWWIVGLWAWAAVAALAGGDRMLGVSTVAVWLFGVGTVLAVSSAVQRDLDAEIVIGAFLVAGVVICATALPEVSGLRVRYGAGLISGRPTGIFAQPNELGGFGAVVACTGAATWLRGGRRWLRWLGLVALTVGLAATAMSFSRGAMIGVTLGLFVVAVGAGAARWRLIGAGVLGLVVVAVLILTGTAPDRLATVGARLATVSSGAAANPYDDRPSIWREATQLIVERPVTGFGPTSFPEASARVRAPETWPQVRRPLGQWRLQPGADHAHNTLLTVGAELGLPAVGLLVGTTAAVALAAFSALRRCRRGPVAMAALAGAGGLACFIGHGIVDFTLRNPILLTTLAVLVGLVIATQRMAATASEVA